MSQQHLDELLHALTQKGWKLVETLPGDDYRISAVWQISRGNVCFRLTFDGLDDLKCLPIEQSYGCQLEGYDSQSLYFGKKSWKTDLATFVDGLDNLR